MENFSVVCLVVQTKRASPLLVLAQLGPRTGGSNAPRTLKLVFHLKTR